MSTISRINHAALFAILSSLADNKQAIGRRYAYWCNGAPALEAAVAAAAMTQDELGHARTLYPLLGHFAQAETMPEQVEPETRTLRYHLAYLDQEFQGWCDFVATNFLLDTALTTFFEAAQNSNYDALRARSRKIVQEERIHAMHADGWVRRLARAGGAVREVLIASLERLWDETLCWFGPSDDAVMLQLVQDGMVEATPDELRDRYLRKLLPVLQATEIEVPIRFEERIQRWLPVRPLPWACWKQEERRFQGDR
ncbi:ring-1,2-phenylacetyl-CoA epoxidase subunit PaaA [Thermosporothrix hazakensis]|jgi:phenylacetate-CoA oxygenase PaaI subunit|uniref:Ring-1,2-phenylacetyl-CoA epoxidase subunit PaaA n=2 Tax=Thermosporothrix TaxID=768650 RepID=A0A326U3M8_THEHA|nr:Phenylacetic acid catabolic protein [Thermosporothrix hazakensis]PZW26680.1 ring-1,2-phenylacetyl-CoA epoxidase subunit PaaA [Thermosporothrix hazakensis]BBH89436.1 phenylacetate-CoA oxygenase subunit PaaI [Thermosporothrix sp. COM3]GCE47619.1 phenylacetate-CoA oxygenase subunit PaaI [Thermosporothrix hazakensis]